MITLGALKEVAAEKFVGFRPTYVLLLRAWAKQGDSGDLIGLLQGTGMDGPLLDCTLGDLGDVTGAKLLAVAIVLAGGRTVTGAHLLAALCLRPGHTVSRALDAAGLDLEALQCNVDHAVLVTRRAATQTAHALAARTSARVPHCRDLTELALEGELDHLCDRPALVDRMVDVLLRWRKGNPVLLGPAGVGKTALVELLARRLARDQVPGPLRGARLWELRVGDLLAGTRFRGDFEQRLQEVLGALEAEERSLLFVDEMHLMRGAGRAEGVLVDMANLLKPVLARGERRIIGATTTAEYHRHIASDPALSRRFHPVQVPEPSRAEVRTMVRRQAGALASFHGVTLPGELTDRALALTERFSGGQAQPDVTVDLLDSAAARAARQGREVLERADLEISLAGRDRAAASVLAPGRRSLLDLVTRLRRRIIGQDAALERIASTLLRGRQLGRPGRPLASMLLAGDTGVGKTETALILAEAFFGDPRACLQVDLGEYGQAWTVARLLGSPPGYRGAERGGLLVSWLREKGAGVLVLDEADKAHPEVHHLLLSLLDSGRLTSGHGDTLDARGCVVVLTANVQNGIRASPPAGFARTDGQTDPRRLLDSTFPRELLGRLDEVVLFEALDRGALRQILQLRLGEAVEHLASREIHLVFDEVRLLDHLLSRVTSRQGGARDMARLLDEHLLGPLCSAMLEHGESRPVLADLHYGYFEGGKIQISSPGQRAHGQGVEGQLLGHQ